MKDLWVELMHEFNVDQLVPELVVSRIKIEVDDGAERILVIPSASEIVTWFLSFTANFPSAKQP